MGYRTLGECQKLVGSQQLSGVSIKEYCIQNKVARSSFYAARDRVQGAEKLGAVNTIQVTDNNINVLEDMLEVISKCSSIENARLTLELAIANQRLYEQQRILSGQQV